VSLPSLRGSTVVLSFIDPVCTSDCPIEAQELKAAAAQLGDTPKVTFVAINANPTYRSTASLQAFDAQERMGEVKNWRFLTGSSSELR
jgi:cytochrome oxidase Cu insertion factor (SCO1/SenC/PrrC family)